MDTSVMKSSHILHFHAEKGVDWQRHISKQLPLAFSSKMLSKLFFIYHCSKSKYLYGQIIFEKESAGMCLRQIPDSV